MPKQKTKEKEDTNKPKKTIKKNKNTKKKLESESDEENLTNFALPQLGNGEIKIISWNVVSFNTILKKGFEDYLKEENPDIILLNETKIASKNVPSNRFKGYTTYVCSGIKSGHHGVAFITKFEPINIEFGLGDEEHDEEGRVITAEFDDFYLVCSYIPNSGSGLKRLDYRMKWDEDFLNFLNSKKEKKTGCMDRRSQCST